MSGPSWTGRTDFVRNDPGVASSQAVFPSGNGLSDLTIREFYWAVEVTVGSAWTKTGSRGMAISSHRPIPCHCRDVGVRVLWLRQELLHPWTSHIASDGHRGKNRGHQAWRTKLQLTMGLSRRFWLGQADGETTGRILCPREHILGTPIGRSEIQFSHVFFLTSIKRD
jgi:hypothetical protein